MRHLTDLDVSKIVTAVAALRDTSGRDRHARYILDYYRLDEKTAAKISRMRRRMPERSAVK
jgi:hypothetical protein